MVAVRHSDADRVLAKPPAHIGYYLFFGVDAGLVGERLRGVISKSIDDSSDAFQLVRLDGDDLAGDPGRLMDEVNTIGLFGGRRAIWIRAGSKNLIPAFEPLVSSVPEDTVVVVEAGPLKKDSALRKLFERERHAAAVECVHDDEGHIRSIVEEHAAKAGLQIDSEVSAMAARSLGGDRLTTRSELEKLVLYTHGTGKILAEDVEAIIVDASVINLDAAIHAAFSGRIDLVDDAVQRVFVTGGDPGMLTGMAMRHAVMFHRARLDIGRGLSRDAAIEKAQRRAFIYLRRDALAAQFDRWTVDTLARAIEILAKTLQDCRKDTRLSEEIAARAFWTLANAARRSPGR
jgi:DNA polymerase-3 subunit delta